ncbi:MAG: hypothetical protein Q7J72_06770 [Candidatus Omnitrophota bacterium]|nr:hypothetical protein [Candidatus Omnitrophota bacterium]
MKKQRESLRKSRGYYETFMPRRRRGTNKDENTFVIVQLDRTIQIIWIPAFAGMTLKNRLKKEGSEVVTKCDQLKMEAAGILQKIGELV